MSFTSYSRPFPTKIIQLMKSTFGTTFKAYYDGDPVYIPKQYLPCLIVDVQSSPVAGKAPTGMIRLEHTISIQAEFNKAEDFNKAPEKVFIKAKLEQLTEGIDPATGQLGERTIVGALQRNYTLGNLSTGQQLTVEYGLFPRGKDVLTQGVTVTGVFEDLQLIGSRS